MATEQENWHKVNLERIEDTLASVQAKFLARTKTEALGVFSLYSVNGKVLLVQKYANHNGFEVFSPLSESMKVSEVEEAIKKYATAS